MGSVWLTQARTNSAHGRLELLHRISNVMLSTTFDDRWHIASYYP
jgi:hypothetical protein